MTGIAPERIEPPAEEPTDKEEAKVEEESITAVTGEVIPRESLESLAEASSAFAAESAGVDIEIQAKQTLTAVETSGRPLVSSSQIEPPSAAKRPAEQVLRRGTRFRDASTQLRPVTLSPTAPDPDLVTVRGKLTDLYGQLAQTPGSQAEIAAGLRSFGVCTDEFFLQTFAADGPGAGDNQQQVAFALQAAVLSPQTVVDTLRAIDAAIDARPLDRDALVKAAQSLHDTLGSILKALDDAKVSLDAQRAPTAVVAGVASATATRIEIALEGGQMSALTTARRCVDLGARLKLLADLPCAARQERLDKARAEKQSAQTRLDAARKDLAADQAGLVPIEGTGTTAEQQLKQKIQADLSEQTRWAQKVKTTDARAAGLASDVAAAAKLTGDAYQSIKSAPGKARPWSTAVDTAVQQLKALKTAQNPPLAPGDADAAVASLTGLTAQVDDDFVAVARRMAAAGGPLDTLVEDGWSQARRLGQLQDRLMEILRSTPATAAALDPIRQQLQATLAGMAAYLAEQSLVLVRVTS